MKKIILFCSILLLLSAAANAQSPVQWEKTIKKIDKTHFELHLKANINSGWHLYSQTTPAGGPLPTEIVLNNNPLLTIEGKAKEVGDLQKKHEPLFGVDVKFFYGTVDFVYAVSRKGKVKTKIKGEVKFMT